MPENKPKSEFWKKLRNTYRFQVIEEKSYEVKWVLELNRLNVLLFGTGFVVFLLIFSFLIFSFTPLKYLLPGYVGTNADEKRQIIALKIQSEELDKKMKAYDEYFKNLKAVLSDSISTDDKRNEKVNFSQVDTSIFYSEPGKLESKFRKDFELLLKQGDNLQKPQGALMLTDMQNPVKGRPKIAENDNGSKTLMIKTALHADVKTVLPGTLITHFQNGMSQVLYIQHPGDILSIYRFNGTCSLQKGQVLDKGQVIGVVEDDKEPLLMLDIWSAGEAIPPGQYLKY